MNEKYEQDLAVKKKLIAEQLDQILEDEANPEETLNALIEDFTENKRWQMYKDSDEWATLFNQLQRGLNQICNNIQSQDE